MKKLKAYFSAWWQAHSFGLLIAFGAFMGLLIHWFELPSFLITLGGMFLARGLGFVVHPESLGITHPFYADTVGSLALPVAHVTTASGRVQTSIAHTA